MSSSERLEQRKTSSEGMPSAAAAQTSGFCQDEIRTKAITVRYDAYTPQQHRPHHHITTSLHDHITT
eukprot:1033648-Amorphochlora_amoeboformis.AAC.1